MTDAMKISLINAYANLLDVFARNNDKLQKEMRYRNDYNNICETIDHLSKEIQKISL